MKVIKLDENNPYTYQMYDFLDWFFDLGRTILPWIFYKKGCLGGVVVHIPRWLTKREMDTVDAEVQELIDNINWE
jgi:hypothetical protein